MNQVVPNNVEAGVCLGFGGTNARYAYCEAGDIERFTKISTPDHPDEFFGWMAKRVLNAGEAGASWVVAGFPGPVRADGKTIGPFQNVRGMNESIYDLHEELNRADPAVGRALDDGSLELLAVNDGTLSAAAAAHHTESKYDKVASLIVGTGIGTGVVCKDPEFVNVYRNDDNPYEIGHLDLSGDPEKTFETEFSGPGIERRFRQSPENLTAAHPAWRGVATNIGRLANLLGIMAGAEVVVPTGGIGSGASDKYRGHLDLYMRLYAAKATKVQQGLTPQIEYVDPADCDSFEMRGAEGVMRAHQNPRIKHMFV